MGKKSRVSLAIKKGALEKITQIAKEIEVILDQDSDWESATESVRGVNDRNLRDNEYLCLFDLDGLAMVHSNRLQEGKYFNSEIALKAARSSKPITQIYNSNVGKLLLDAACPVFVKGKHIYTVRAGIPIQKIYFSRQVFMGMLPILLLGGAWVDWSSFSPVAIFVSLLTLIIQAIYSNWLKNKVMRALDEAFKVTQAMAKGDLNVLAKAHSEDELGNLAYEINKVAVGMKSIVGELASVSEKSQDISQSQAAHTQTLAVNQQSLAAIFEEFSAGALEQINAMQIAQQQVDEIQSSSQNILKSTRGVLTLATSAKEISQEGTQAVEEAIREMGIIYQVTEQTNTTVLSLAEQAQEIGNIVSVINDMSTQTNLLALNAAIEAARAGEQGKGFAVVAEEVRKLADNSVQSSNQIMELITNIRKMINSTVENMGHGRHEVTQGKKVIETAGKAISFLNEVITSTEQKVEANLDDAERLLSQSQILAETQQQATAIAGQFAEGAQAAAGTVEQQMRSTEEVASISGELAKTSIHLNQIIKRFKL